jgi:competence protein ComEA
MPRSSRLTLWCLALLLSCSLYYKGRAPTVTGEGAAFLRSGTGITVRLAGDFPHPGVYRFPNGVSISTVTKMTLPGVPLPQACGASESALLANGDIVTLKLKDGQPAVFSVLSMGAKERMLLGIPLDPDLMRPGEWSALPGIGPVVSARIDADRQKYGAFGSLDGLLRVPGIGPGKLAAIRRYF